jgi:hypothetical protein
MAKVVEFPRLRALDGTEASAVVGAWNRSGSIRAAFGSLRAFSAYVRLVIAGRKPAAPSRVEDAEKEFSEWLWQHHRITARA